MAGDTATASIQPIPSNSINRLCSGQGILNLAVAVKELVENSLDAGASRIDIVLKEYGADLIEVADNGPGVSPENYEALTKQHYTSKICQFADLERLSSFGFRGEALSSLCAMSKVIVTTMTADEKVATRIEYDSLGCITSKTCVARCIGTTVSVADLFCRLPVRRKELKRNVKREYGKLVTLLQGYALIAKRVRLLCTNKVGGGGRHIVFQTQGSLSIRENVISVLGVKTFRSLDWIDASITDACRVEGFLSKPKSGTGSSMRNRQWFFLNSRPVILAKAGKYLNELYRLYNPKQFPTLILDFTLPSTLYDINVSPDKRTVFVHDEDDLMKGLAAILQNRYDQEAVSRLVSTMDDATNNVAKRTGNIKRVQSSQPVQAHAVNSCGDRGQDEYLEEPEVLISEKSCLVAKSNQHVHVPQKVSSIFERFRYKDGDLRMEDDVGEKEEFCIPSAADFSEHSNQQVSVPDRFASQFEPSGQKRRNVGEDWGDGDRDEISIPSIDNVAELGEDVEWEDVEDVRRGGSICSTSNVAERSNREIDEHGGIPLKLKPFRQSVLLQSFRKNSSIPILSSASFVPSEMQSHGTALETRPTGLESRIKRGREESGKWPPLKKDVPPDAACRDQMASKASTAVVDINCEFQEGHQLSNLRQGKVSRWFTGANQSSGNDANCEATSSKPESRVHEACGSRRQGRVSDWFTGLKEVSERDVHNSEPESRFHKTADPVYINLSSSDSEGEFPSELPTVVGTQDFTHALGKSPSVKFQCQQDMREIHDLDSRKQRSNPSVIGLKQKNSVLPFNRVEAAEVAEAIHQPKFTPVIKCDIERLKMLSERGLLGHENRSNKMEEYTVKRSFKFATVADIAIGDTSMEKEAALKAATKELEQNLKKADLKLMKVLCQFELRFILAKLDRDMFIVDQHAADETYHFEHLMRTAVVDTQQLPRPVPLELEAEDERIVRKNKKTFRQNGFHFLKDKTAEVGHRLQLSVIPSCIDVTVGLEEMRELISMISKHHSPDDMCLPSSSLLRPSRYSALCASQAKKLARRAGDVLSKEEMQEIISRMADLEVPWTCPHGRPTIRHMVDLDCIAGQKVGAH